MEEIWQRYYIDFNSNLFRIFSDYFKKSNKNHKEIILRAINQERNNKLKIPKGEEIVDIFKIILDWQDDDICGIEIYKKLEV